MKALNAASQSVLVSRGVPYLDRAADERWVLGAAIHRRDALPVRTEQQSMHGPIMSVKCDHFLSRRHIPESYGPILPPS